MHGLQTLVWRNRKGAPATTTATIAVDLSGRTPFVPVLPTPTPRAKPARDNTSTED